MTLTNPRSCFGAIMTLREHDLKELKKQGKREEFLVKSFRGGQFPYGQFLSSVAYTI